MTNKLKYFIGNWKMYGSLSSFRIINSVDSFIKKNKKKNNIRQSRIVMCVPGPLIYPFYLKLKKSNILLGGQNCHSVENYGPFTGSVSSAMLKKIGAEFVILGHSDNRKDGDTDFEIGKKIQSALNKNLKVIFCIGETLKEKIKKRTLIVLKNQIKKSIKNNFDLNKIFFAYEPIWSIGTGKTLNKKELIKILRFIKKYIQTKFKFKKSKILYGGSVHGKNVGIFSKIPEIDGFLIGGSSKTSKKFIDIINNYYKKP